MDLESLVRQAAASAEVQVTAQTLAAQHGLVEAADLPAHSFLRLGASPTPLADVPPWAHGMVTDATLVASATGLPARVLTVAPVPLIALRRGAGGPALAYIGAPASPPNPEPGATLYTFGAGSVWIDAPLLTAGPPADGLMGVKVAAVELIVPGPPAPGGGDIVLALGGTARLTLKPAPQDMAAGLVNDGSATTANLPGQLVIAFTPAGLEVLQLGDSGFTALGATVGFSGGSKSVGWDGLAREIVFGYASVSLPSFAPAGASLQGTAPILAGEYRLPVAQTTAAALGAAANGGVPTLIVGAGLVWRFAEQSIALGPAQLLAEQGSLGLRALVNQRRFTETFTLWTAQKAPGGPRPTSFAFTVPRGALLVLQQSALVDARLIFGASLSAALDRPVTVTGSPPVLDRLLLDYAVERTPQTATLGVLGLPRPPGNVIGLPPLPIEVLVIENALLRTNGAAWLWGLMKLDGNQATAGLLVAGMALRDILPIMPDPYISNDRLIDRTPIDGGLLTEVGWSNPGDVGLGFTLLPPANASGRFGEVSASTPWGQWQALFDVSGRADQLGLFMQPGVMQVGQIVGQAVQLPGEDFGVFTVPHISWEAVIADTDTTVDPATGQPVPTPRHWFPLFATNDGEPARLTVETRTLVPVEPLAAVTELVDSYRKEHWPLRAAMTLPFGLTAFVDSQDTNTGLIEVAPPTVDTISASFPGLSTGTQLRLAAAAPKTGSPMMPGHANATDPYAASMLDTSGGDISGFWNHQFGSMPLLHQPPPTHSVPVGAIDLSGYGASMFSFWQDPTIGSGISQARFDVVVGRTCYEVVQAQSFILPGRIPVVDTTIFGRDADGYVVRHNTGWQPRGDGLFDYPGATKPELGAVTALTRVRNIRATGQPDVMVPNNFGPFRPVVFDCDVLLDPDHGVKPTGSGSTGSLASRGMVGYLRLRQDPKPPMLAEAVALLKQVQALGAPAAAGPVAAEAQVAGTGFNFSLTAIEVQSMTAVAGHPENLAVALRGTPHLPRDGAWSVSRRGATDTAPKPVDPLLPVPLVRRLADKATWHIMEPSELNYVAAGQDPPTQYGLLQSTATQKMLLEHPQLIDGAALPLRPKQVPGLADVGSLLGIPGLLPDIGKLLQLPNLQGMVPRADGFQTNPVVVTQTLVIPETTLISLPAITVDLATVSSQIRPPPVGQTDQSTITVKLDAAAAPGDRWSVSIDRVVFKLVVDGFGSAANPLVAVSGTLTAQDGHPPGLGDIQVYYGTALQLVTKVLQGIQTIAQFLPGAGSAFSVDFAGTTLKIRESFTLPTLPLGFGYLQNIALDMGFDVDVLSRSLHFAVGVGTDQDPFDWLVSPLAGNGLISLGAQDKLGVKMQAGIGAGLGIDLAIASGSAAVTLAVQIDTTQNPFVLMVVLTGNASVDVLDGLTSASLTLSAGVGVGVSVPPPPIPPATPQQLLDFVKNTQVTLEALVSVGIHISVCWVVHVDWDGSWPFKETVTGAALTGLLP